MTITKMQAINKILDRNIKLLKKDKTIFSEIMDSELANRLYKLRTKVIEGKMTEEEAQDKAKQRRYVLRSLKDVGKEH